MFKSHFESWSWREQNVENFKNKKQIVKLLFENFENLKESKFFNLNWKLIRKSVWKIISENSFPGKIESEKLMYSNWLNYL
jgi:hypothetical protein